MRISDWSSDVCSSDLFPRCRSTTSAPAPLHQGSPRTSLGHGSSESRAVLGHRCSRSEEHTSELQSLMRISYAVFCLKKKNKQNNKHRHNKQHIIKSNHTKI